jgi:NAD(P)-dependent dehydrogenase (short-subunit alcohol dehydrogenase family)
MTAQILCSLGYYVTISCRDAEKGNRAIEEIKSKFPDAMVDYLTMELTDLSTVQSFANNYRLKSEGKRLDLFVANAGIMNTPYFMTKDGFESQWQVNHLAHMLLLHNLLPQLLVPSDKLSRVVILSSRAHMRVVAPPDYLGTKTELASTYDGWGSYGRSKLANALTSRVLAKRFPVEANGVMFNSVHPGLVDTKLLNVAPGLSSQAISVEDGVRGTIFLATSPEIEGVSGVYWHSQEDGTIIPCPR